VQVAMGESEGAHDGGPHLPSVRRRPGRSVAAVGSYNERELLQTARPLYTDWRGSAGQDAHESDTEYRARLQQSEAESTRSMVAGGSLAAKAAAATELAAVRSQVKRPRAAQNPLSLVGNGAELATGTCGESQVKRPRAASNALVPAGD
jgi:hypothetical protein